MSSNKVKACIYMLAFFFVFFINLSVSHAGRPYPHSSSSSSSSINVIPHKTQHGGDLTVEKVNEKESCEGIAEKEEEEACLMRRTLEAHTDYIYTQKQKP